MLKQEMKRTTLIQRLNKPNGVSAANIFSFGGGLRNGGFSDKAMGILKDILSFDYMGSAEFEFGAIPEAFKFIADQSQNNAITSGQYKKVYYICPKSYETGVKDVIDQLLYNESGMRLQEPCDLKSALDTTDSYHKYIKDTVGWLELDNGFFMFIDEVMFKAIKKIFGIQ